MGCWSHRRSLQETLHTVEHDASSTLVLYVLQCRGSCVHRSTLAITNDRYKECAENSEARVGRSVLDRIKLNDFKFSVAEGNRGVDSAFSGRTSRTDSNSSQPQRASHCKAIVLSLHEKWASFTCNGYKTDQQPATSGRPKAFVREETQ